MPSTAARLFAHFRSYTGPNHGNTIGVGEASDPRYRDLSPRLLINLSSPPPPTSPSLALNTTPPQSGTPRKHPPRRPLLLHHLARGHGRGLGALAAGEDGGDGDGGGVEDAEDGSWGLRAALVDSGTRKAECPDTSDLLGSRVVPP
ncbi:hypothetical protein B0H19DRAFT_1265515 [Mycena capillaripes]|nr:hypothetical protein B0H19DRAFT_1265515 [Mycena capillaripes]